MPLLVLVIMPVAVGAVAALALPETRHASLAAAVVSTAILYVALSMLNPGGEWTLLATFLVSPLTLAFALAAVLVTKGHGEGHHRRAHGA